MRISDWSSDVCSSDLTDVDAGTGDVMLADAGNDFVGTVDIIGGTVAITDANALTLGTVAAGQLTATSVSRLDPGTTDRRSVVWGKSGSVHVALGGGRNI